MTFTQPPPSLPPAQSRIAASAVIFRLNPAHVPLPALHRDAIASTLEAGHGARYHLLAYAILDDRCFIVLIHAKPHGLNTLIHEWGTAIGMRLPHLTEGIRKEYLPTAEVITIDNPLQITTAITAIVSDALRKPYVSDDYPWLRVMPVYFD